MTDLTPLFAPPRVAVLSASRSPEKLGHRLLRNLVEGYGIAFPAEGLAHSVEGALSVAEKIGYPVVVKLPVRRRAHAR